ncbi:MAG: polysaccharide biosynthesis/export family protein, partial [Rubrivivax sp.]|nr:polysaccharide biosynthesis/export family protein [Rubrivivax sp.]
MPLKPARPTLASPLRAWLVMAALAVVTLASIMPAAHAQQRSAAADGAEAATGGPIRLRQSAQEPTSATAPRGESAPESPAFARPAPVAPYVPSEFEQHVQRQTTSELPIRRLGAELSSTGFDGRGAELSPLVPPDYLVSAGDEILVTLWGSVDADLRLLVDRTGRITMPRVGTVQVAGVRHANLQEVISTRVAQVFRNFQLSVSLGQLRGIRVFVTGQVIKPGALTVSSLSSVVSAWMQAGGPAAVGRVRTV